MSLLGIDIGITGCKAVAFTRTGDILGHAYREYPLKHPQPDWVELEVHRVWNSVQEVVIEAASHTKADPVRALSICSQGEAFTPVDRNGTLLRDTPICFDNRGEPYVRWLGETIGAERLMHITGQPLGPMFSLSKLLWLKEHEPEIYEKTWKFLCYEDLIIYQLGLPPTTDYTVASRTLCFDIIHKEWSQEILGLTGLDGEKFPRVVPSGTPVGTISARMADALSLPHDVVVVTGGHDHPCGALGAGVRKPRVALESIGTVDCLAVLFDTPRLGKDMLDQGFPCYPHTIPELYVTLAFNFTGGSLLKWFRDVLGGEERRQAEARGDSVYSLMIEEAAESRAPVCVLPYFTSSGTPYMDPHALGAMLGLTLNTSRADIIRGCLEGVVLEMKLNLATLDAAGIPVEEVRTIGGGAQSRRWLQMRADAYDTRVVSLDVSEAACLGAAILAGKGSGVFDSVPQGIEATVREKEVLYPRPEARKHYEEQFALYREVYPTVKNLSHRIKQLHAQPRASTAG